MTKYFFPPFKTATFPNNTKRCSLVGLHLFAWKWKESGLSFFGAGLVGICLCNGNKLSRLDLAIKALDVKLEHWEWYEIYTASGQKILR